MLFYNSPKWCGCMHALSEHEWLLQHADKSAVTSTVVSGQGAALSQRLQLAVLVQQTYLEVIFQVVGAVVLAPMKKNTGQQWVENALTALPYMGVVMTKLAWHAGVMTDIGRGSRGGLTC